MNKLEFDEAVIEQLERVYQTRDVRRRRALIQEALGAKAGERILDVGCGPGFFVAELLDQVGAEGSVVGVDASGASVAAAARRCEGRGNVAFHEADATSLPVRDGEFDAALSVQVLEYVPDATDALREMHRVLRPGGRVLIWDVDWATLSMRTADPERMERVLGAWDSHLTHASLPQTLTARLREAGFGDVTMEGHTFATNELSPEAYGGYLPAFIEGFVVAGGLIGEDEAKAWGDEQRELGERGEFYFAVVQFCFTATRPA